MKTRDMIKSNWITKGDLEESGPIVGTVSELSLEEFTDGAKYALWFREMEKGLLLNVTKIKLLELALGDDTDYWVGGRVRMSFDPTVMMGGKLIGGIKIEVRKPPVAALPAAGGVQGQGGPSGAPRFDPMTGQPLLQPAAPPPATWREQADAQSPAPATVSGSPRAAPAPNPEFDDDIPF